MMVLPTTPPGIPPGRFSIGWTYRRKEDDVTAVLIQADDFSGAAEVGQCFATQGLGTRLLLAGAEARGTTDSDTADAGVADNDAPDVLVVDTHTRAVSPEAAEAAVSGVFGGAHAARARVLFK
jgi:4-hydroxythreonine-4-phosphate dehydrogenase